MNIGTTVYVIDDDEAVRDSLALRLDAAGFKTVTFPSALDFLTAVETLAPGCVLTDVRMPEIDGLELQNRLTQRNLHFPVIVMTGHGDVALAVRAMKAGAIDFIEKPFGDDTILDSIRLAQSRFAQQQQTDAAAEAAQARITSLTPRERDVFEELVRGKQNKVIAHDLSISPRTVEVHRARVLEKMQARSLSELVRMALAAGVQIKS